MRLSQFVADLQRQIELLRVIRGRRRQTRIGFDFEVLGHCLAVHCQLHLIRARHDARAQGLTRPQNHSGKTHRLGIAHVPNKPIKANVSRGPRRPPAAKKSFFTAAGRWFRCAAGLPLSTAAARQTRGEFVD